MNLTIFIAVWLLTPLASADSISRERREGTLPLCFVSCQRLERQGPRGGGVAIDFLDWLAVFVGAVHWAVLFAVALEFFDGLALRLRPGNVAAGFCERAAGDFNGADYSRANMRGGIFCMAHPAAFAKSTGAFGCGANL